MIVIALMMEAASTSETSVNFYQTTRRKLYVVTSASAVVYKNLYLRSRFIQSCGNTGKVHS
jgi:hypothetical protein